MKDFSKNDLFLLLNRRCERFQEELKCKAPEIIIKNELHLIIEACSALLCLLGEN